MNLSRLDRLENRTRAMMDDQVFVEVTFADRSRRTMRLADVIDMLQDGPRVVDVQGEDGPLLQLILGIVKEDVL